MKRLLASAALVAIASFGLLGLAGPASAGNNQGQNNNNQGQNNNNQGHPTSSTCLVSTEPGVGDGMLTGPINTFLDFTTYLSTDGTCVRPDAHWIVVSAATPDVAAAECLALSARSLGAESLRTPDFAGFLKYPSAPADWWVCEG
jgi:hypothetical protein